MTTTTTPVLGLRVDSGLTADATYNLYRLDTLGSLFQPQSDGSALVQAQTSISIVPNSAALGGTGTGGVVSIGSPSHSLTALDVYGALYTSVPQQLADQGLDGLYTMGLSYDSTAGGVLPVAAANYTLSVSLAGANRQLTLGGPLSIGSGGFSTSGAPIALSAANPTSIALPPNAGTNGYVLTTNGAGATTWAPAPGSTPGVTSVALSAPSQFAVSGSPVTSSGTLSLTLQNQSGNTIWASPSNGTSGAPGFRSLVLADLPAISTSSVTEGSNLYYTDTRARAAVATEVGQPNGIAGLDGSGHVPTAQLPPGYSGVTSVGLSAPSSIWTVSGSPVTAAGTLALSLTTQSANSVWAGPTSGSPAAPTFRPLTTADLPTITQYISSVGTTSTVALAVSGGGQLTSTVQTASLTDMYIAAGAAIDTTKLGAGTVSSTVFGYLAGVTGAIQPQLDGKQQSNAELTALAGLSTTGLVVRTGAGGLTTRSILTPAGTSGLTGSNLDGVAANPSLAVDILGTTTETTVSTSDLVLLYSNSATALRSATVAHVLAAGGVGTGTVTSVGLTASPEFTVSGSPVTTAGVLNFASVAQATATVWAGPVSGSAAQPAFRSLQLTDLPALSTTNVSEGTNLYFTTARAQAAISTTAPLVDTSGVISIPQATSSVDGYLAAADFTTFTSKLTSPLTTAGDLLYESAAPAAARLPIGSTGQILTVAGGLPTWAAPATNGTVTSVSVVSAAGVSGSVATATTTPAITIALGAITPGSVAATGTVTGSNLSGTNTGDQTITLTGDVTGAGTGTFAATISANAVTNAKLAQMPTATIKGNAAGSTANVADLTGAQATSLLTPVVGATGTSAGTQGVVPAPPAFSAQYGDFLSASGAFQYVDQSQPIYTPFSFVGQTASPVVGTKYNGIVTWTGIDGHKQYAACLTGGTAGTLFIYDVTNPRIPVYLNSLTLAGCYNAAVATIAGAVYMFVPSSGSSNLYCIDVTNPLALATKFTLLITGSPGSLYNCAYSAGYVYLATQNKGLTVVDVGGGLAGGTISVPVQSFQEGGTTNKTAGVAISGSYVYTTNYQTTFPATVRYLKTWALTGAGTLAVPSLANTFTVGGGPVAANSKPEGVSISTSGLTAIVMDTNQNVVQLIDITTPTSPVYLSYITATFPGVPDNTLSVPQSVGNVLYIPSGANATYGGAIDLVDITNRAAPVKVSTVYNNNPGSPFGSIALLDGYIFAADYGSATTFSYLDVFAGANPIVATTIAASTLSLSTPLGVTSGGTGLISSGASGNVLTSSGGTWISAAPSAPAATTYHTTWATVDGTTKTVTHSLGTLNVIVQLFDTSTGDTIQIDSTVRTSTSVITLTASQAPASSWIVMVAAVS